MKRLFLSVPLNAYYLFVRSYLFVKMKNKKMCEIIKETFFQI